MTLTVGVTTSTGVYGGGTLDIGPTWMRCRTGPLARRVARSHSPITQADPRVIDVYVAKLIPFWINTSFVVADQRDAVVVSIPGWRRKRIVETLRAAGFAVTVHPSWHETARLHAPF